MELARNGIPISEVYRDPRPSRLARLRAAIPVIKAREELEESEGTINLAGLQGEMEETGGPAKKKSDYKVTAVGYLRWQEAKQQQAYPEHYTPEAIEARKQAAKVADQKAKADAFFGSTPDKSGAPLPQTRVKVVRDEEGNVTFIQSGPKEGAEGNEPRASGIPADHEGGRP